MFTKGKGIQQIRIFGKMATSVRYGTRLVWEAIRSCFGAGRWLNDRPWVNEEGWKN